MTYIFFLPFYRMQKEVIVTTHQFNNVKNIFQKFKGAYNYIYLFQLCHKLATDRRLITVRNLVYVDFSLFGMEEHVLASQLHWEVRTYREKNWTFQNIQIKI